MGLQFGEFVLLPEKFELRQNGQPVQLEPQVFMLLELLIKCRDRVVSKDEIVEEVWNGRIVSDAAIASRVKLARVAVGDDGTKQHTIRTIHSQGFRFVAEVSPENVVDDQQAPIVVPGDASRRGPLVFGLVAILVVFAATLLWKNIHQNREDPAQIANMQHPLPDEPSIAVLPFDDMSDGALQEYFVDGMTEDLITDLSKISGLFVIARNSTAAYKNKIVSIRDVAETLGVRFVLEGSVRREGDQIRVNAQLIDAISGFHVWAQRYDRPLTDVFDLQDEIIANIISEMSVELLQVGAAASISNEAISSQAYDLFLQGEAHYRKHTAQEYAVAIKLFEDALELEPAYGRAHARLARIYWFAHDSKWDVHLGIEYQALSLAEHHLASALKYPLADAYVVSAEMYVSKGQNALALADIGKALDLEPSNPDAHNVNSWILLMLGNGADSEVAARAALRLDPDNPASYLRQLGEALMVQEKHEEAALAFESSANRSPSFEFTYSWLSSVYGHLGRVSEANEAVSKYNELSEQTMGGQLTIGRTQRNYGGDWYDLDVNYLAHFISGLRKAGVPEGVADISEDTSSKDLVSTIWFKPSVFQTDKEIQRCAGGAQLRKGSFNCLC